MPAVSRVAGVGHGARGERDDAVALAVCGVRGVYAWGGGGAVSDGA